MNYSDALKKKEKKEIVFDNTLNNYLNNGYSIIRKHNNNIKIIYSYNNENIKKLNNEKKNELLLNKMINNWNDFREQDIEYYGSRSIYYNYKTQIENMVKEDNKINEELYNTINNLNSVNSDNNSDDEYN
tara:strand:+ start:554 stop:943 length:390 start_codon:yes stop_codon:yes gene_type:complete